MALASVGQVYLMTFKGLWHGQQILSTFHYGLSVMVGAPTVAAVSAELTTQVQLGGFIATRFLSFCPPQYVMGEIWVQAIAPTRLAALKTAVVLAGTYGSASNTANLAGVVTRKGEKANRHNIGSLHVPLANTDIGMIDGLLSPGQKSSLLNVAISCKQQVVTASGHTFDPILFPARSLLITDAVPIVNADRQITTRVMRRRTVGVGI